jgi:release factor glutamine methyltransferase
VADELVSELTAIVGRREATWICEHAAAQGVEGVAQRARGLAQRRAQGEPLQYVLGTWPFRDLELEVGSEALIPRPETEQVVEIALGRWREHRPGQGDVVLVDLGTGSGAIGLSMAHELAAESPVTLWLTDRSRDALGLARRNAERLKIEASFGEGSWFEALDDGLIGGVHLLVVNPPYVPIELVDRLDPVLAHEPPEALYAERGTQGAPGFSDVESVLRGAPRWLAPGGIIVLEMGENQVEVAVELAWELGFVDVRGFCDLAAKPRGVVASIP